MAKQHQNDASAQRSCTKCQTLVTDRMGELYRRYTAKLSQFSTVSQESRAAQLKKNRKTTRMRALGVYNVLSASRARRCLQKRRLDHSPRLVDCNRGPFFYGPLLSGFGYKHYPKLISGICQHVPEPLPSSQEMAGLCSVCSPGLSMRRIKKVLLSLLRKRRNYESVPYRT